MIPLSNTNSLFNSMTYRFKSVLVDPGDLWEGFDDVSDILLTHAHYDHIYGLNSVVEKNPEVLVYTNEYGKRMLLDDRLNLSKYQDKSFVFSHPDKIILVNDGDRIRIGGGLMAEAVFTPGHNPSCITWIVGDAIFTGDSYIHAIKTVTNLPGGNRQQANESEQIIKLLSLGKKIYPGHGGDDTISV